MPIAAMIVPIQLNMRDISVMKITILRTLGVPRVVYGRKVPVCNRDHKTYATMTVRIVEDNKIPLTTFPVDVCPETTSVSDWEVSISLRIVSLSDIRQIKNYECRIYITHYSIT